MYKNQLQELAQRSCFNLPSYSCIREGPDHAPRFKASVIFNGEIFECPNYCSTLRHAEHAAAEVALNALSSTGPAKSLTARVLDETGVYKNLLQETAHRAGLNLPVYTTVRSGPGHLPVFTCAVNIANMNFTGVSAKTKKQAEKNAAIAAWSALKTMSISDSVSQSNKQMSTGEVEEQLVVSRVLSRFKPRDEGKNVRRWDYNRSRKGMIRCYRDNNNTGSSSTSMKSTLFHQIKSMDPVMERSFLNLLPPPPPRTISKILPALSSSPLLPRDSILSQSPLQSDLPLPEVKITSQVKIHNVSTVMQEHQKDEEERLGIKDNNLFKKQPTAREEIANPSSSYKPKLFPVHEIEKLITSISKYTSQQSEKSHIRTNLFALPNPIIKSPIARPVYTGGFQRLAPAVHIRSVIPVCAAPPQPSKPIVREATTHSVPTAASTFISSQTRTEEISSIESKLEKLEL